MASRRMFLDKEGDWDWDKQEGQRWMLQAARERGVRYSLGFSITAPYFMTKNGMARASEKLRMRIFVKISLMTMRLFWQKYLLIWDWII